MGTPINTPLTSEIWHLTIDDLLEPLAESPRLGGPGPFVINLSASTAPISVPMKPLAEYPGAHVYQIQRTEDRRVRYRLRLGPFETEAQAEALLATVREIYPSALTASAEAEDLRTIEGIKNKIEAQQLAAVKAAVSKAAATASLAKPAVGRSAAPESPKLSEPAESPRSMPADGEALPTRPPEAWLALRTQSPTPEPQSAPLEAAAPAPKPAPKIAAGALPPRPKSLKAFAPARWSAADRAFVPSGDFVSAATPASTSTSHPPEGAGASVPRPSAAHAPMAATPAAPPSADTPARLEAPAVSAAAADPSPPAVVSVPELMIPVLSESVVVPRAPPVQRPSPVPAQAARASSPAAVTPQAPAPAPHAVTSAPAAASIASASPASVAASPQTTLPSPVPPAPVAAPAPPPATTASLANASPATAPLAKTASSVVAQAPIATAPLAPASPVPAPPAASPPVATAPVSAAPPGVSPIAKAPPPASASGATATSAASSPLTAAPAAPPPPVVTIPIVGATPAAAPIARAPTISAAPIPVATPAVPLPPSVAAPRVTPPLMSRPATTASNGTQAPPRKLPAAPASVAMPVPGARTMPPGLRTPAPRIHPQDAPRVESFDTTQTLRPLTPTELEDASALRWFVIQLSCSEQAFDPDSLPNLDIFSEYRLYSVASLDQGKVLHTLRVGFFSEESHAKAVAGYLGTFYENPAVKRVSTAERTRFAQHRVEARKDIGATGKHTVIEITDERVIRPKRSPNATVLPGRPPLPTPPTVRGR